MEYSGASQHRASTRETKIPMQTPDRLGSEQLPQLLPVVCVVLALIGLVATSLRLGDLPFWVDESIAALPALSIHSELLPKNPFDLDYMPWQLKYELWDPATPLYRYSLAAFTAVVGFSELHARWFSVLMGALSALALLALARRLHDRSTAWMAAALLLTSPTFMLFAREARHFTFLMCMSIVALGLLYEASQRPSSRATALWPAGVVAVLLTQTLGYAILPIVGLYVMWVGPRRVLDLRYWPAYVAAGCAYAAVMAVFWDTLPFFHQVDCGNRTAGCQPSPWYYIGALHEFLAPMDMQGRSRWWRSFSLAQPLALLGLIAVALRGLRHREARDGTILVCLWLLAPLILLSTREVKFARYLFIWAFPVCCLLAARGIVELSRAPGLRRASGVAASVLVIVLVIAPQLRRGEGENDRRVGLRLAMPSYVRDEILPRRADNWEMIRQQADLVAQHVRPDDVIVSAFDDASLGFRTGRFVYGFLNSSRTDRSFLDLLARTRAAGNRVWFFDTLPHWNFCLTSDPEPLNIDCAIKYARFYAICTGTLDDPDGSCIRIPVP